MPKRKKNKYCLFRVQHDSLHRIPHSNH